MTANLTKERDTILLALKYAEKWLIILEWAWIHLSLRFPVGRWRSINCTSAELGSSKSKLVNCFDDAGLGDSAFCAVGKYLITYFSSAISYWVFECWTGIESDNKKHTVSPGRVAFVTASWVRKSGQPHTFALIVNSRGIGVRLCVIMDPIWIWSQISEMTWRQFGTLAYRRLESV